MAKEQVQDPPPALRFIERDYLQVSSTPTDPSRSLEALSTRKLADGCVCVVLNPVVGSLYNDVRPSFYVLRKNGIRTLAAPIQLDALGGGFWQREPKVEDALSLQSITSVTNQDPVNLADGVETDVVSTSTGSSLAQTIEAWASCQVVEGATPGGFVSVILQYQVGGIGPWTILDTRITGPLAAAEIEVVSIMGTFNVAAGVAFELKVSCTATGQAALVQASGCRILSNQYVSTL